MDKFDRIEKIILNLSPEILFAEGFYQSSFYEKYLIGENRNHLDENSHAITHCQWGGTARCMTSDGRNVNMAEELNRLEKEKDSTPQS